MNEKMYDKIRGALYGVAVGDALGAPLEFMTAEDIQRRHGHVSEMIGGGWLNVKPGEVTDDTQMTICVARGITMNPEYPIEEIGGEFVKWYHSRPKDIGSTCSSSIYSAIQNAKWHSGYEKPSDTYDWKPSVLDWRDASEKTDKQFHGRSGGNGSLMRTVYAGLFYTDLYTVTGKATEISKMTHYDETAARICALYCRMVWRMIHDFDLQQCTNHFLGAALMDGYEKAFEVDFKPNPSGYSVDSFLAALYSINQALNRKEGFRQAIETAVNLGGDADTIGAITGGLAGALWGYEAIPETWIKALSLKDRNTLDELAYAAAQHQEGASTDVDLNRL